MQAFLSELQAIVAKAACEAEAYKIQMAEAEAAHAKEVHRMQVCAVAGLAQGQGIFSTKRRPTSLFQNNTVQ